jgi:hypothetical protein
MGVPMGKNPNSFEKRSREVEKKRKAQEKRERRRARKDVAPKVMSKENASATHDLEASET